MVNDNNALSRPQADQLYGDNPSKPGNYAPDEWTQCEDKPTKLYQLDFDNGQDEITSPQSRYFIDEDTYNDYLKKDEDGNLIQDENGNNVFDVQRHWYLMMADSYYSKPQREEFFVDSGFYKYHEAYHLLKFANEKQILEKAYHEYLELKKNNLWGSKKYY